MMKSKSIFLLFLLGILFSSCSKSDIDLIAKTAKKLQDLESVQYKYDFKNYNDETGKLGKSDSVVAVFDFTSNDTIFGARYNLSRNAEEVGFNGITSFYTNKEKKYLVYSPPVHSKMEIYGIQYSVYSIKQIRDFLPQMLNDTAIKFNRMADTIIDNTECLKFEILMQGKSIDDLLGEIIQIDKNENRIFALMIGKKDFLPRQFIQYYKKNSPVWVVSYHDYNFSFNIQDSLFDYSLFSSEYKKYTQNEFKLITRNENILKSKRYLGTKALDWTLPSMAGDSVTLSKIDANLVMLEFWFPYCTGCVLAIPLINEIYKKYKNRGLKIFGIEYTQTDSIGLTNYINKRRIEYPTLYSGKEVATKYGVKAGPTVFLIKDGNFVYAKTGFLKDELIMEIEKNLK